MKEDVQRRGIGWMFVFAVIVLGLSAAPRQDGDA
jgi:hypothetical protein